MNHFEQTLHSLLDNGSYSVKFVPDGIKYKAVILAKEDCVSVGLGETTGEALDRALKAVLMEYHIAEGEPT